MARAGMPLKGVAVFHGSLGTKQPVEKGQIKGEIAVFTGAADPFVPAEQVQAFEKEMKAASVRFILKSYPGVKHSFTNPEADGFAERFGMPLAYNKAADTDSWHRLTGFLHRIFSNKEH
jgi:dienelactone hydrolase